MNGYWYYRRYETGKEYPIYARRKGTKEAPEEILLNVNEMAKGHDFFEIGDIAISPDSKLMAWAEDTVGRRQYVVRVMDLATRKILPIALPNVENNIVWAGDNQTLPLHREGSGDAARLQGAQGTIDSANHADVDGADPLVWEQKDDSFYTQVYAHQGREIPLIHTQSTVSVGSLVRRRHGSEARVQGVPAARARSRVPGGARQRPLDRAHQLAGEELPHRRGANPATKATARSGQTSSRIATMHSSTRSTCRKQLPHHRGTFGRPAQAAHPSLGWAARTCSSRPTSPATPWRSTSTASSTATSCATPTPRWSRRAPPTTTTSRPASASC